MQREGEDDNFTVGVELGCLMSLFIFFRHSTFSRWDALFLFQIFWNMLKSIMSFKNAFESSYFKPFFKKSADFTLNLFIKCQNNIIILTSSCCYWNKHNSLNSFPWPLCHVSSNILHSLWRAAPYRVKKRQRVLLYPIKYTFCFALGIFWSYAHVERGSQKSGGLQCRWFIQGTAQINRIDDAWTPQSHNA